MEKPPSVEKVRDESAVQDAGLLHLELSLAQHTGVAELPEFLQLS
jgi:hypothetical protein